MGYRTDLLLPKALCLVRCANKFSYLVALRVTAETASLPDVSMINRRQRVAIALVPANTSPSFKIDIPQRLLIDTTVYKMPTVPMLAEAG